MQIPRDDAERVQLWIALGHQPGVSAWFTVWRVVTSKRVQTPKTAPMKGVHQGTCTA